MDFLETNVTECKDTNCAILPLGFLLLAVDSYFDLRWVCRPSPTTNRALRNYYTMILRPSLKSPGFWFPLYVIFKLCIQCHTQYNWMLFGLFIPISVRYIGILNLHANEQLQHWWTVVVLRVGLFVVNSLALQAHVDCSLQHTWAFLRGGRSYA